MKLFYLKKDVENSVAIKEQKQLSQVKGERHYRKLPLKSTGLRDYKRRAYIRGASNRNRKSVPLTAIYKYTVF